MKKIFLAIFISVFCFSSNAQSLRLKKADKLYNQLAYQAASDIYEDFLDSKEMTSTVLNRLAMCYYNTNQMEKSAATFAKFIKTETATTEELFYYAQALKQSGKIKEGDEQLRLLYAKSSQDLRAKSLIENLNYFEELKAKGEQYSLKNLSINSEFSDFGGYEYFNSVVFLSARNQSLAVKRQWTWDGTGFLDAFLADDAKGDLKNEALFEKISSKYHEGPICFDGGTGLYFTRNSAGKDKYGQDGIQNLSLYFGQVDVLGGIDISVLPFCSSEYSVGHPTLSPDKKTLYFASDMPGSQGVDIYQVAIEGPNKFGVPKKLEGKVNTEGDEMFPFVSSNGTLYFSSNGHIGFGGLDVFMLNKNGDVVNLGSPLNSINDDFAFILKQDNKTGFVSSNRAGGKGGDDIYSFTFTGPIEIEISGFVTLDGNKKTIPGAYVVLIDEKGKQITSVLTDESGHYVLPALSGKQYTIQVKHEGFQTEEAKLTTQETSVKKDFSLKESSVVLLFNVEEKKTETPLSDVKIKLEDLTFKTIQNLNSDSKGSAQQIYSTYKVGDSMNMQITLSKEGYLTKTVKLQIPIQSREVNVSEMLDIALSKLQVGNDLSQMIDINPIYFYLGKFAIRKDAAIELDKIVKVMNEYPSMKIELGSHTDCRSSKSSNQALSDKRAKASADYIKKRITNPERIKGVGYGESRLKVNCPCEGNVKSDCPEEEHQKNRRTEFIIVSM